MERVGFFGGCFNPPTIAHIELAKLALKEANLDKIIFVPMNSKYDKEGLISEEHRFNMLQLLIKNESKLEISDFEFNKNERLYAIDAFKYIDENYLCDKYFILGADNYKNINLWKNSEDLKKHKFIVLDRKSEIEKNDNIIIISNNKFRNFSSSIVRNRIKDGLDVKEFIAECVYKYIKDNKLYI